MTASTALPPSAGGGIARLALARVAAEGIDPGPILRRVDVSPTRFTDPTQRLGTACQIQMLNLAAEVLRDDLLGFHLARDFDLREAGLLYYVIASSATLGEGLARGERYTLITNEGVRMRYAREPELRLTYSYLGVSRHTDRHQIEFWTTALVRICREVTGIGLRPVGVELVHPRRNSSAELDAFFGCEVSFAAERDQVAFPSRAARFRLVSADPYLNDLLIRHGEDVLARRSSPAIPIRASIENALMPLLPHGKAQAGEVARVLGMSRRTLARRLAAEKLTFGTILNELRRDLARDYLADGGLSISRIAWLVGFREVSAFTHAFKRWTGQTPTGLRGARPGVA
ncbi:MAG: AraC family transcriptional regulator [Microvirga sp.]